MASPRRCFPKNAILKKYHYICVYCGRPANSVDHIEPYDWNHNNSSSNLVAACLECNFIASDRIFNSFQEKADYIRKVRSSKKWRRRIELKIAICCDCKLPFRPGVKGATNLLCADCAALADMDPIIQEATHKTREKKKAGI